MTIVRYDFMSRIESVQPARSGSDPEHSGPIFKQRSNVVTADRIRIFSIVPILPECIAVVAKESRIRGEPNKALIVLRDSADRGVESFATRGEP